MNVDAGAQAEHDAAIREGRRFYCDPATGYYVMTADTLRERGHCCGNGCRHCPYDALERQRAGRPGS